MDSSNSTMHNIKSILLIILVARKNYLHASCTILYRSMKPLIVALVKCVQLSPASKVSTIQRVHCFSGGSLAQYILCFFLLFRSMILVHFK